jgi:hypothetical protein
LLLWALFGASLCVLLIACTHLASLLLAKTVGRRKELAVRAAIGAGRERLVRQMLTEAVVLAAIGGGAGIVIAIAATPLLSAIVPSALPLADATVLDGRVLAFTAFVTLGTGLLFGVALVLAHVPRTESRRIERRLQGRDWRPPRTAARGAGCCRDYDFDRSPRVRGVANPRILAGSIDLSGVPSGIRVSDSDVASYDALRSACCTHRVL